LKEAYGIDVMKSIQMGINHIDKQKFIELYRKAQKALSSKNIYSGFEATGLVPLDRQQVLNKFTIKHITPPTTTHGPPDGIWAAKNPLTTAEVQKQIQLIKELLNRNSENPPNKAIRQLAKATESTIHKVLLLG
jgi:hypothetical protein